MAVKTQQTGSGGNNGVEARIARLESDVAHLCTDVADIKLDLRELRKETGELRKEMHGEFKSFRYEFDGKLDSFRSDMVGQFRILWRALFFITLGLAGMMAQGFGWL